MNRMTHVLASLVVLAGLAGCEGAKDQDAVLPADRTASGAGGTTTPAALAGVPGELAENIYDAAKAEDWATAAAKLDSLQAVVLAAGAEQLQFDRAELTGLAQAVAARDQVAALEASNALTRDFAGATASSSPIPREVVLLDFYGRELEIGAAEREAGLERTRRTAADIRSAWDAVRPRVLERGGTAEAQSFDGLVRRVETAGGPGEYGAVAAPLLDEVDRLEAVFAR